MDDASFARALVKDLRMKDLLFVQKIADARSLSAAAGEFGLTQPAASRWLRDLEQLFAGHLFTRDRVAGMTPTPVGELVVERGRALVADVASLSSEIRAHRAGRGGRLQLGVIPYVSTHLLERLVSTLVGEHAMTVSVIEGATAPLLEGLRMQHLHAVIGRCAARPAPSGLRQEMLFTQSACLLVHAKSGIREQRAKLSNHPRMRWVVPPLDSPTWQAIVAVYGNAKMAPPTPAVETASTKAVHALVAANVDMVAVLPLDIGRDLEQLGGVRVVAFSSAFKMPPVGLIAQARQWNFSNVAALRNVLRSLAVKQQRAE
ncbi:MAG TPA: LysR family transcriptional regulator [Ramlibacter sp.]|uniref:LysR family transcriptional regulator n=1 Tax=Ramlibacter sp. TaxID=1917967 RepID=UPI002C94FCE8|nr:LysR family transcriptional regulator [Ramlibacter sp.]HVZ46888.1 LysR family transcriptional regulator [Ramlibacter sp.]